MRLDEIRKRLEAATPGPWEKDLQEGGFYVYTGDGLMVAEIRGYGAGLPQEANLTFMAAAPEDISYLLARVEKLEGLLTRLIDDKPCSIRYSGNCVVHKYGPPCPVAEAHTLLAGEESKDEYGNK